MIHSDSQNTGCQNMSEKELCEYLQPKLENHFKVWPEVYVKDIITGKRGRLDFLCVPLFETVRKLIGIEVKTAEALIKPNEALRQCMDYRRAVLESKKCSEFNGMALCQVHLVTPQFFGYRNITSTQFAICEKPHFLYPLQLAQKYHVGILAILSTGDIVLTQGKETWWTSRQGVRSDDDIWHSREKFGSL